MQPGAVFEVIKGRRRSKSTKETQLQKLVRILNFVVAVYIPWWITCGSGTEAAANDLLLLKVIASYEKFDSQIANAAFIAFRGYPVSPSKPFSGHLWYLTSEMLPLCLFSTHLPDATKASVAKAIIDAEKKESFTSRKGNGFGRPVFPQFSLSDVAKMELKDFVGPDSWMFFEIIDLNSSFLSQPVSKWCDLEDWKATSELLKELQVKNDTAERGVKLGHSFLERAKIEENYQHVLQVVENSRKARPDQRSRKSGNDNWFLSW